MRKLTKSLLYLFIGFTLVLSLNFSAYASETEWTNEKVELLDASDFNSYSNSINNLFGEYKYLFLEKPDLDTENVINEQYDSVKRLKYSGKVVEIFKSELKKSPQYSYWHFKSAKRKLSSLSYLAHQEHINELKEILLSEATYLVNENRALAEENPTKATSTKVTPTDVTIENVFSKIADQLKKIIKDIPSEQNETSDPDKTTEANETTDVAESIENSDPECEICEDEIKQEKVKDYKKTIRNVGFGLATYGLMPPQGSEKKFNGVGSSFNSTLATAWSNRAEFDAVNLSRDTTTSGEIAEDWDALAESQTNPYEILNVHKAYGHGLSGAGQTVAIMDGDLCYDAIDADDTHIDLKGKTVTVFGSHTESHWTSFTNASNMNMSLHGCHVATTAVGAYNSNQSQASNFVANGNAHFDQYTVGATNSAYVWTQSPMGVAYNSNLHFADTSGDNTLCTGNSDTDCYGVQHWELALEDAYANDAVVSSNSWGFTDDSSDGLFSVSSITDYMTANSATGEAALVAHAAIDSDTDGTANVPMNTTSAQWTEYVDALNTFQEKGVVVWAASNQSANMSTVYGSATNRVDVEAGFPAIFPQLAEAWITVVNVPYYADGSKRLLSVSCGVAGIYCVSADGYNLLAGGSVTAAGDSNYVTMTGTSMATPQVAGLVALLNEAFPDNTPEQIAKRLFLTADNSWLTSSTCYNQDGSFNNSCGGITGTLTYNGLSHGYNDLYGHGTPDIFAALQPLGSRKIHTSLQDYSLAASLLFFGYAYGDLFALQGEQAYYRDQLDSGFKFELNDLVFQNYSNNDIYKRFNSVENVEWSSPYEQGNVNLSFMNMNDINNNDLSDDHKLYLSVQEDNYKVYSGNKYSIDHVLNLRNSDNAFSTLTRHSGDKSYLSLTEAAANGQIVGADINISNNLSFGVSAYRGKHEYTDLNERGFLTNLNYSPDNLTDISFFIGQNIEDEGLLRSSSGGAFGKLSGSTMHSGIVLNKQINDRIFMAGLFDYGWVSGGSQNGFFLNDMDDITTTQFNLGFVIPGLTDYSDILTFNISQPLRIESGQSTLNLTGLKDSEGNYSYSSKTISLEPSARELNYELGYERDLGELGAFRVGTQFKLSPYHSKSTGSETMIYSIYGISF